MFLAFGYGGSFEITQDTIIIYYMTKTNQNSRSQRRFAIVALIAPSIVFIFSLFMLAIINLIFNPTFWMVGDTEPVNPTPISITIINGLFITTGLAGFIALLPGVVIGVLLLTRLKNKVE